ncbi:MAG TPA: MFS transporter [Bacillota bacterium]|nr:MFS transporter [Bacillota bacterium]
MTTQLHQATQKWAFLLFTIGVFMAGLDNGIISTAMTTINESFKVPPSWGAWSITLYTLGIAISAPIIGKLADRFGRRRLFVIEIALFGIGSLLVALSPNFTFLLISRLLQSLGGGGIFIIGSAHVLATFPKEKQGKALGILGGMHGLSAVIGPNLGAVILHITGVWQWMFLINIPIAILLVVFGWLKIPESKPNTTAPIDMVGTVLLSIAILSFMYGITSLDGQSLVKNITNIHVWPFLLFGLLLFILFIIHERNVEERNGDPIVSYSLLTKRLFQITLFLGLLSGGFLAGIIFIPAYVEQVLQVPVENAGFWLTPLALSSGIGAGLGGYLTDKYGAAKTLIVAGVMGVAGFLLFPFVVSGFPTFVVASILAGVGLGILLGAPLNVLVGESAQHKEQGSALGTLSLIRQIGLTLFPTIFAGFMTRGYGQLDPVLKETYGDDFFHGEQIREDRVGELIEWVGMIDNPNLRTDILDTISTVMKDGFSFMFITAGLMSAIVVCIGIWLSLKQKRKNEVGS